MLTYIVRRLLLIFPVVIGVMTITFILFTALPITDQLQSHFGDPPRKAPCAYSPSCICDNQGGTVYPRNDSCLCYDPQVWTTPTGVCVSGQYNAYVHRLGLDKPLPEQWATFMYRSFTFQWGAVNNNSFLVGSVNEYSFLKGQNVTTVLGWFLPYTLELAGLSLVFILLIAIPLGNLSAVNRNRPVDQLSRVMSFSGYALPGYLLGSFVVVGAILFVLPAVPSFLAHSPWCNGGESLTFEFTYSVPQVPECYSGLATGASYPSWLAYGYVSHPTGFVTIDAALHGQYWLAVDTVLRMILPALVITFGTIAGLLRFVRNSMLEVMNLDYVRTARAKGVPERTVIRRHAGRNSLNVTITVLGLTFAFFIGGFPVVERVFSLAGVGQMLAYAAIPNFDFSLLFGSTILFTFLVVGANIVVDVLYAYLDPRVRLG